MAALVCGILGVLGGLIPILFLPALSLGVVAVVLGVMAYRRARRVAVKQGRAGIVLGGLAIVLGIVGMLIVNDAFEDLDDDDTVTDRPESTVTPGANPETTEREGTTTEPAPAVPEPAIVYFEAFASEDLSRMGAMLDNSVEGSPAALFATHQIANVRSLGPTDVGTTVDVGEDSIVLRSTSYDMNGNEVEETSAYSNFDVERDRLVSFAVDDAPVADRIRAGDPAGASGDGVTARIVTAYATTRGDLALNVDVTNTRSDVIELSDYEWSLITPDGRQVAKSENVCCPVAPSIQPGATAGHVVYYEQVGLGGTLKFVAFTGDFTTEIRFDVPVPS